MKGALTRELRQSAAILMPTAQPGDDIAERGIGRILAERDAGFAEAVHVMEFPRSQGFVGEETQAGDIFQRALIVDTLCDFSELRSGGLEAVIDQEIDYLLGQRRLTGAGGWSYFPGLRELPADADDLAQIMQALIRTGRNDELPTYCDGPLSILLDDSSHDDGSFETWIIPKERDSELELQHKWAQMAWGTGPDVEVMANLLYALWLYDPHRFARVIGGGAEFIKSRQQEDGSWKSTWYHGPFYGTWVCLRLLARASPRSPATEAASRFLISAQRPNGGWGLGTEDDPLSTAFALLGLSEAGLSLGADRAVRATALFSRSQLPDGGWPSVPFIRMDLGRPTGRPWATLTYGSQTITTAFVVKALVAAGRPARA